MDMGALHACILRMFKYIDAVCREEGITYFLSGGSAIGAVRDHGFIAWDDDADIMLPRADYERFLTVMAQRDSIYKLGHVGNRNDWSFPFARVWDSTTRIEYHNLNEAPTGVFVDVYPMDGLPDSMRGTRLHYLKMKALHVCLNASIRKRFKPDERFIAAKRLLGLAMRAVGSRRICRKIDRIAARRPFDRANYVGCTVLCHYMSRERFPRSAFDSALYLPFEDTVLPVPTGFDAYLSALYGDYMSPPPAHQRESEHHMEIHLNL